jgi:predicted CXXCH cytochrome family protein
MRIQILLEKIDKLLRQEIGLRKILLASSCIVIFVIAGIIGARMIFVPSFTSANDDFRYQWHRVANQEEWKAFKVKYQGSESCKDCHTDQYNAVAASVHAKVSCESCHGPAIDHPDNPAKLAIDKSKDLCLRCHTNLPYRAGQYKELPKGAIQLKMVSPDEHNPGTGVQCIACHDAHKAAFKWERR